MNKQQFLKGITFLTIAYNKEFTTEQVDVWYEFFKDEDYEVFRQAVKRVIPQKQFMPSIAELKSEIAMLSNPVLQLNAEEEWDNVLKAVRRYGSYRESEAMESFNPYTRNIVRQVGFKRICMSDSIQWERKEFLELFNMRQDRDSDSLLLAEPVMTLAELSRTAQLKVAELEREEQKLLN